MTEKGTAKVSAEDILRDLKEIAEQPYERAKEWKKNTGGKIIGFFPMHFPEELIHASGLMPVMLQEGDEPVTEGHAYYYPFFCGYSRSMCDQAAKDQLSFLDVMLSGDYCIQAIGAGEVLQVILKKAHHMFFRLVVGNQPWTQGDILDALKETKRDLEAYTGKEITTEKLRESIRIYNEDRSLMRKIYEMRSSNPGILNSREMLYIVKSSMVMPKQDHINMLKNLLPVLAERKVAIKDGDIRVYLTGSLCGATKIDILSIIEESGAVVVGDDLVHGYQYISTDIADSEDPMGSIAAYYMQKNKDKPCSTRNDPESSWPQWLVNEVKKQGADQLIVLMAKFCEPHMYFYPDIKEAMEAADISHLLIEIEHEVVSLEALRTRIEAFIEMENAKKHHH
ncbi:MAG: 2-hydroxyacyl-CoA dehydratase [Deltaproteobacteria bacterium]|nr:2-hydroxyacyl-CoA dehydratase [Deltaproteobacteria bacterium]